MRSFIIGAVALAGAAALSACGGDGPASGGAVSGMPAASATPRTTPATSSSSPAAPASTPTASPRAGGIPTKTPATGGTSDVSQLVRLGITLNKSVLIDVADDGVDRFLQVGANGVVDFTGTTRTDATMMALRPAPARQRNQVRIMPPFWNEDLGAGSCVADTPGAALTLETCRDGRSAQLWTVVPAGDSGQFELRGAYGILTVDQRLVGTGRSGRTGLQTIPFQPE